MQFGIGLSFATAFSIGHYLQQAISPSRSKAWPERLFGAGLSIPLGLGASSWLYTAQRLVTLPSIGTVFVLDLLAVAALALAARSRKKGLVDVSVALLPANRKKQLGWALPILFLVIVTIALSFLLEQSIAHPYGQYDAWAQWDLKSRILFKGGTTAWQQLHSATVPNPGYPLLLPCSVARVWTYAGSDTPIAVIILAVVTTFGTVLLLFGALCLLRGPRTALIGSSILLLTTPFLAWGASQYADVPFGLFALGSASLLWMIKESSGDVRFRYISLAGLLVSFAASTKDEGLLFLPAFCLVLAVTVRRDSLNQMLKCLAVLTVAACPWLLLTCVEKALAKQITVIAKDQDTLTITKRVLEPQRYALIAKYAAKLVLPPKYSEGRLWPIRVASHPTSLLFLALAIFGLRRDWGDSYAPLSLALIMASGYLIVYIITPFDLDWHLKSSCERLWLQLWPLVLYGLCCQIESETAGETVSAGRPA